MSIRVMVADDERVARNRLTRLLNQVGDAEVVAEFADGASTIAAVKAEKGHKYAPKGHRHAMACRYAVKQFLVDLYTNWRKLEGLPVAVPYSEGKLGMKHSA